MTILQERHSAHFPEMESEVQSSKETCLRSRVQKTEFKGGLVSKPKPSTFSPCRLFLTRSWGGMGRVPCIETVFKSYIQWLSVTDYCSPLRYHKQKRDGLGLLLSGGALA